jgi:hypothetical protein
VEYVSLFFWQFFYFGWLGALIITVTAALMCLGTYGLIRAVGRARVHPAVCFVPGILLALVYNSYAHDLTASVQIVLALGLANLYARVGYRRGASRVLAFLAMSVLVYYVSGGGYVLWGCLCGIVELLRNRSILMGALYVVCSVGIPGLYGCYSYDVSVLGGYGALLALDRQASGSLLGPVSLAAVFHVVLVAFFPLVAIWAGLDKQGAWIVPAVRNLLSKVLRSSRPGEGQTDDEGSIRPVQAGRWTFRSLGWFVILAVLTTSVSLDRVRRAVLATNYAASNRNWQRVLEEMRVIPPRLCSMYVMNDVNRALYHTGRLPYEMFSYPQRLDRDSIFLAFAIPLNHRLDYMELSEMFYELGFVNDSEHFSHEALEGHGHRPELLKRLAKINILKSQPTAARAFIGALGKNLLHRRWAQEYLRRLDEDPLLTDDEELNAIRGHMIRDDYKSRRTSGKEFIGPVMMQGIMLKLQRNRHDKMAFECLMGHYLLTKQLDKVIAELQRLDDFGYPDIPRHYEEAILLYAAMHPGEKFDLRDLQGRQISKETLASFARFREIVGSAGDDKAGMYATLRKSHDKTYFLYHVLGISDSRMKRPPSAAVTGATK